MVVGFTSAIADFDQKQFDCLDRTAGFASSYSRLHQRELDPRWISRYLRWFDGNLLRAAVPIYRSRMKSWPDAAYDPRSWDLPDEIGDECSPDTSLVVGGCSDRRTALHLDAEARTPGLLRRLVVELAGLAAGEERCLTFPYMLADAKNALAAATGDRIIWAELARDSYVSGLSHPEWESKLPRKVRYTLRRDRGKIAAASVAPGAGGEAVPWDEVRPWAAELISRQHALKGDPEISEWVEYRYADLQENPDADVLAFTAQSGGLRGVSTLLVWEDEMEVCEIGLTGDDSDERHALYVSLGFHQPFQFAQARGIDLIRYGTTAETPKAARGAVFEGRYCGVLSMDETRRIARSGS